MLMLLTLPDCSVCEDSKNLLKSKNVEFGCIDLSDPSNYELVKKFKVKVAGTLLYDPDKDQVISVYKYIESLS